MDETREGNNKGKGPTIDCTPFTLAAFVIELLECLLVHLYEGTTDMSVLFLLKHQMDMVPLIYT